MTNQDDFNPSTYKVKLTLYDGSILELFADQIQQFSQNMGDIRQDHERCGIHPFLGPLFCPDCKAKGSVDHCGKYFVYQTFRGEPELIEFQLKDGRVLYAKDYERVKDTVTIQADAKLDEEDIKRTMEEQAGYYPIGPSGVWGLTHITNTVKEDYTFIVTTPTNDRITIKAAYCEVDGDTLYFEDDNRETIYALAVGHWVRVERVDEEQLSQVS